MSGPKTDTAAASVRVVRLLSVKEGREAEFIASYSDVLRRASRFPGHLSDQLCRSIEKAGHWLLTSEWQSLEDLGRWRTSPEHTALLEPMNACLHDDRWTATFQVELPRVTR